MNEPKRAFVAGMWGRCGRAIPDPQASELDNVVPLRRPAEDMRQGRDHPNPVPRYSMLAGKPPLRTESENRIRAAVWAVYVAVVMTTACAAILTHWPN